MERVLNWLRIGFGVCGVETSSSVNEELGSKMDRMEIGYDEKRWLEMSQDPVQPRALVGQFAVLNLLLVLAGIWLISMMCVREIGS
jgi:hypothetical protein